MHSHRMDHRPQFIITYSLVLSLHLLLHLYSYPGSRHTQKDRYLHQTFGSHADMPILCDWLILLWRRLQRLKHVDRGTSCLQLWLSYTVERLRRHPRTVLGNCTVTQPCRLIQLGLDEVHMGNSVSSSWPSWLSNSVLKVSRRLHSCCHALCPRLC